MQAFIGVSINLSLFPKHISPLYVSYSCLQEYSLFAANQQLQTDAYLLIYLLIYVLTYILTYLLTYSMEQNPS